MGGDIDASALTGKEEGKNVFTNFGQYKLRDSLADVMRFDHHKNDVIRTREWFDAIVCDRTCCQIRVLGPYSNPHLAPYGIRAGARKVGKPKRTLNWIPKDPNAPSSKHKREQPRTLQQLVDLDNASEDTTETNNETYNTNNNEDKTEGQKQASAVEEKKDDDKYEEQKQAEAVEEQKDDEKHDEEDKDDSDSEEDKENDESTETKDEKQNDIDVPEEHKNNPYYGNRNKAELVEKKRKARNLRMRDKMKEKKQKKYYENKALREKGEYVPQCVPYSVVELLSDLLGFAARTLVV